MKKYLFLASLALVLVSGFQNCAEYPADHADGNSEQEFFNYPYKSAPKFYASIQLYKPSEAIPDLTQFRFIGTVAYVADGTAPISYEVKIRNADGVIICPTQTGTLAAGVTSITFDCASAVPPDFLRAQLMVSANGESEIFQQAY
jgi:hypothetical protein